MYWRLAVVVILCLPAWAILSFLGPVRWLEAERGLGLDLAGLLAVSAFYGIFISVVTTPLAMFASLIFLIWEVIAVFRDGKGGGWRVAIFVVIRFVCLAALYIGMLAAAVYGMYIGYLWSGAGMRS